MVLHLRTTLFAGINKLFQSLFNLLILQAFYDILELMFLAFEDVLIFLRTIQGFLGHCIGCSH